MTGLEFKEIAKNAVIEYLRNKMIPIGNDQFWIVDTDYEEGFYGECIIKMIQMKNRYAKVTYNQMNDQMYIDFYEKINSTKVTFDKFNSIES